MMPIASSFTRKAKKLTNLFSFTASTNTISSASSPSSLRSSTSSSPYSSSSSESMMEENIQNAGVIIKKWEINGHFISIFHQDKTEEATNFVNGVKVLHRAMRFMASHDSISEKLTLAQGLMQIAMKRLEAEFRLILLNIGEYVQPESVSISSVSSIDSEDELSTLRLIAETMITCGYGTECISVYKITRKSTIDEALFHLGIQRYTSSHIRKLINTPCFGDYIKTWLNAVQIAVKTLFLEEKFLSERIFASYQAVKDSCFQNSTNEAAFSLFKFPELIAKTCCKRMDSDSIFVMMNLHNSISDLWPDIEAIFSSESVSSVQTLVLESLQKLADSARRVLSKVELSIHKNSSKITVSSGGIHPLNDSVMNYLSTLANYGSSLNDIIIDYGDLPVEQQSLAVSVKLERIILVLLCKLERKAKFHDSTALSYLFLVNNLSFIIEKVRTTKLQYFIGNEWIVKHEMKLNQYALSYELTSWNKVISCLPKDLQVSPEKARDCFRKLYFTFQEVCDRQISWIVVDGKLRDKMEASIINKLVPMYEEFYGNHLLSLSEDKKCVKMLIRLSPENMVKNLSELFPSTPVAQKALLSN